VLVCFERWAVADVETASIRVEEIAPVVAELAPSATETDSPSIDRADATKVAITESVTIAAPSQEAENSEPEDDSALCCYVLVQEDTGHAVSQQLRQGALTRNGRSRRSAPSRSIRPNA
jgi:hypothetical protein